MRIFTFTPEHHNTSTVFSRLNSCYCSISDFKYNKAGEQSKNPSDPPSQINAIRIVASRLLKLLLWAELVGVSALLLSAVGGTRWETSLKYLVSML